jgi:hypothetical protein
MCMLLRCVHCGTPSWTPCLPCAAFVARPPGTLPFPPLQATSLRAHTASPGCSPICCLLPLQAAAAHPLHACQHGGHGAARRVCGHDYGAVCGARVPCAGHRKPGEAGRGGRGKQCRAGAALAAGKLAACRGHTLLPRQACNRLRCRFPAPALASCLRCGSAGGCCAPGARWPLRTTTPRARSFRTCRLCCSR